MTLLHQGLFGGLWLIAARLRLARRPAWHWAVATSGVALGMSLILGRGTLPDWLSLQVSNVVIIASLAVLRRGIRVFTRTRPTDGEHAAVVAAGLAVAVWSALAGVGVRPMAIATSAALGFVMLRAAFETRRSLAGEFGRVAARWCALPAGAFGALFTVRAALLVAAAVVSSIAAPGTPSVGLTFDSLLFGLVINTTLISMTVLRLVRRLQYQSDHDGLTGPLNRRAMERELRAEAQRQRRSGVGYAVLSLDIDHFKRINDRHGHATGAFEPVERLQRRLDRALYAAKHGGSDRIVPAEAAVPEDAALA